MNNKNGGHHITPLNIYTRVFLTLVILTVATVVTSYFDFGTLNILIAMLIATVKALLVILFFMGLRYEGLENNAAFFCSFVFLAIFVGLTGSDLFYRGDLAAAKVDISELAQAGEPVDVSRLVKPTPELLAKGKKLFTQQCVSCHGPEGKGDGAAAASLNPHPRNFTSPDGWKFGRTVSAIFKTVTNGSPGTPMPPFSGLTPQERFSLAHFVRTITPNPPADSAAELAALAKEFGGGAGRKPHLSIEQAMAKVAEEWERAHKR